MKKILSVLLILLFLIAHSSIWAKSIIFGYDEDYFNADEVNIFKATNILTTTPKNKILKRRYIAAKNKNKNILIKISQLKHLIKTLQAQKISKIVKPPKERSMLHRFDQKLQDNYKDNLQRDSFISKELKKEQKKLRQEQATYAGLVRSYKYKSELTNLRKNYQAISIQSYRDEINYHKKKLINLRHLVEYYSVEMTLIENHKGKGKITNTITLNSKELSKKLHGIKDIKLGEGLKIFKKKNYIIKVIPLGFEEPALDGYRTTPKKFKKPNQYTRHPKVNNITESKLRPFSLYKKLPNILPIHYDFLPKTKCDNTNSSQIIDFRTSKTSIPILISPWELYKKSKNVILTEVTNIRVENTDTSASGNPLLKIIQNNINQRINNIQFRLNAANIIPRYNLEILKVTNNIKYNAKIQNTRINNIHRLDKKLQWIFYNNGYSINYKFVDKYRKEREKLFETYLLDQNNLLELQIHLTSISELNNFLEKDIATLKYELKYFQKILEKAQYYYADTEITIETNVLASYKGSSIPQEKLLFISTANQRIKNECTYDKINRYINNIKPDDVVNLYLDEEKNISHISKFTGGNFILSNLKPYLTHIEKVKSDSYKAKPILYSGRVDNSFDQLLIDVGFEKFKPLGRILPRPSLNSLKN